MMFNKAILAIFALFVVILSAAAVSAIDGDVFVADEFADSTDGEDPIDVSDSVNLSDSLDVADYESSDDEPYDDENTTTGGAADDVAVANAAEGNNNVKVSVGSTTAGNPLVVLLLAMAVIGTAFARTRK